MSPPSIRLTRRGRIFRNAPASPVTYSGPNAIVLDPEKSQDCAALNLISLSEHSGI